MQISFVNSRQVYPKGQADPDNQHPDKWSSTVFGFCKPKYEVKQYEVKMWNRFPGLSQTGYEQAFVGVYLAAHELQVVASVSGEEYKGRGN